MKKWNVKTLRPEELCDKPENYYTEEEVEKYAKTKAIKREQQRMAMVLEHLLEMHPHARVLDLGCGPGFSMEYFKENGYEIIGIDIVEKMVEKAREKGLNVIQGDMRNLEKYSGPNSFDYVISISALQWMSKNRKDIEKIAKGIYYVLKPSGKFGIQFYPKNGEEIRTVKSAFSKFFKVQIIIENPHSSRKRRIYVIGEKKDKNI